jgi:hypothetical protein
MRLPENMKVENKISTNLISRCSLPFCSDCDFWTSESVDFLDELSVGV